MAGSSSSSAREHIKANEGYSETVYTCSQGKRTIGYGFNLDRYGADGSLREVGTSLEKVLSEGRLSACAKDFSKMTTRQRRI